MESEIANRTYHPTDRKPWIEVGPAVHLFFPESLAYETTTADASPGQTLFSASSSCTMCNNQPASDMNDNQFLARSHTPSVKEKDEEREGEKETVMDESAANQKKRQEVRDDASTSGQKARIKPQSTHETEYVALSPKCTISKRMPNNALSPKGCQILHTAGIGMIVKRTAKRGVVVNDVGAKQNSL